MNHFRKLALGFVLAILVLGSSAMAQDLPFNANPAALLNFDFSFSGGPSAIGSDGTLYVTTSYYSFSWFGSSGTATKDSKLRAFKSGPTSPNPDATLTFSGYATHLSIGKDDRLFLVVGNFSFSSKSTEKTKLYLIKKELVAVANGLHVDAIAQNANNRPNGSLDAAIKVEISGYVISLKVRSVGDKEYLYVESSEYDSTAKKSTNKLLILNSATGEKVREATLD